MAKDIYMSAKLEPSIYSENPAENAAEIGGGVDRIGPSATTSLLLGIKFRARAGAFPLASSFGDEGAGGATSAPLFLEGNEPDELESR